MEKNKQNQYNEKSIRVKVENPLQYAYAIKYFMLPLIPIKLLQKDWKYIKYSSYKSDIDRKFFNTDCRVEEENGKYYISFSTKTEKFLFPISYAKLPFKINGILKCIYACLASKKYKGDNSPYFKEFMDAVRDKSVDVGIAIWIKNNLIGLNNMSIKYKEEKDNPFCNLINSFNDLSLRYKSCPKPLIAYVIDKKDFKIRTNSTLFLDLIKSKAYINSNKEHVIMKVNRRGEIIEECNDYKENALKGIIHYDLLPEEVVHFLDICSTCTTQENQSYISMALLKNSDIILVDTGKIEMVKRNGKWFNVSYTYFRYSIKNIMQDFNDKLIRYLYFTVLKACMNDEEITIQILYAEKTKEFKENILSINDNSVNKMLEKVKLNDEFADKRIQSLDKDEAYTILLENDILSLTEQGFIFSMMNYNELNNCREDMIKELSNYGLVIRVSKDYLVEIYMDTKILYSTNYF